MLSKVLQMSNSDLLGSQTLRQHTFHHSDLSQSLGGLDQVHSQEHRKISHVEGTRCTIINNLVPRSLLRTRESIKCLWAYVRRVTFRLLFIILLWQMPLSPFLILCIYVTEVVKQKCTERCWPWPLTPLKHTYKCQANNWLPTQSNCLPK